MTTTLQWPGEDEGRRLHAKLLSDAPTAHGAFAEAFYAPLCQFLACAFPHISEDLRVDVASDLIFALIKRPQQYDPDRLSVCGFLRMAARLKLYTATVKESRRLGREVSLAFVAEPPAAGNRSSEAEDDASWDDPRLVREMAALAPVERIVFELLRAGVRDTPAFARAIGLDADDPNTARTVKRIKDTLKARLSRAVGGR